VPKFEQKWSELGHFYFLVAQYSVTLTKKILAENSAKSFKMAQQNIKIIFGWPKVAQVLSHRN
jgi:hypothetical protein